MPKKKSDVDLAESYNSQTSIPAFDAIDAKYGNPVHSGAWDTGSFLKTSFNTTKRMASKDLFRLAPAVSDTVDEVGEVVDMVATLMRDNANIARQSLDLGKKIIHHRIKPLNGLIPDKAYAKLHNLTEDKNALAVEENAENDESKMKYNLDSVFSDNQGLTSQALSELNAKNSDALGVAIASSNILNNGFRAATAQLSLQTKFMYGVQQRWMRRSLELQYKHIAVAEEGLNLQRGLMSITSSTLASIVTNTAIPEESKQAAIKKNKGLFGKFYRKTDEVDSLAGFAGRIINGIRASDTMDTLFALPDILGIVSDMDDSTADLGDMGVASNPILSTLLGTQLGKSIAIKLGEVARSKYFGGIDNLNRNVTAKNRMFKHGGRTAALLGANSDSLLLQGLVGLADINKPEVNVGNAVLNSPTAKAEWNVMSQTTLIEIIPRELARIRKGITDLFVGKQTELETYDLVTRKFETIQTAKSNMAAHFFGSKEDRSENFAAAVGGSYSVAEQKGVTPTFHGDQMEFRRDLQRLISNAVVMRIVLKPGLFKPYLTATKKSDISRGYIADLIKGLTNPIDMIQRMYTMLTKANGKEDIVSTEAINKWISRELDKGGYQIDETGFVQRGNAFDKLSKNLDVYGARGLFSSNINEDNVMDSEYLAAEVRNMSKKSFVENVVAGSSAHRRYAKSYDRNSKGIRQLKYDTIDYSKAASATIYTRMTRLKRLVEDGKIPSLRQVSNELLRSGDMSIGQAISNSAALLQRERLASKEHNELGELRDATKDTRLISLLMKTEPMVGKVFSGSLKSQTLNNKLQAWSIWAQLRQVKTGTSQLKFMRATFGKLPSIEKVKLKVLEATHAVTLGLPANIARISLASLKETGIQWWGSLLGMFGKGDKAKEKKAAERHAQLLNADKAYRLTDLDLSTTMIDQAKMGITLSDKQFAYTNTVQSDQLAQLKAIAAETTGNAELQFAMFKYIRKRDKELDTTNQKDRIVQAALEASEVRSLLASDKTESIAAKRTDTQIVLSESINDSLKILVKDATSDNFRKGSYKAQKADDEDIQVMGMVARSKKLNDDSALLAKDASIRGFGKTTGMFIAKTAIISAAVISMLSKARQIVRVGAGRWIAESLSTVRQRSTTSHIRDDEGGFSYDGAHEKRARASALKMWDAITKEARHIRPTQSNREDYLNAMLVGDIAGANQIKNAVIRRDRVARGLDKHMTVEERNTRSGFTSTDLNRSKDVFNSDNLRNLAKEETTRNRAARSHRRFLAMYDATLDPEDKAKMLARYKQQFTSKEVLASIDEDVNINPFAPTGGDSPNTYAKLYKEFKKSKSLFNSGKNIGNSTARTDIAKQFNVIAGKTGSKYNPDLKFDQSMKFNAKLIEKYNITGDADTSTPFWKVPNSQKFTSDMNRLQVPKGSEQYNRMYAAFIRNHKVYVNEVKTMEMALKAEYLGNPNIKDPMLRKDIAKELGKRLQLLHYTYKLSTAQINEYAKLTVTDPIAAAEFLIITRTTSATGRAHILDDIRGTRTGKAFRKIFTNPGEAAAAYNLSPEAEVIYRELLKQNYSNEASYLLIDTLQKTYVDHPEVNMERVQSQYGRGLAMSVLTPATLKLFKHSMRVVEVTKSVPIRGAARQAAIAAANAANASRAVPPGGLVSATELARSKHIVAPILTKDRTVKQVTGTFAIRANEFAKARQAASVSRKAKIFWGGIRAWNAPFAFVEKWASKPIIWAGDKFKTKALPLLKSGVMAVISRLPLPMQKLIKPVLGQMGKASLAVWLSVVGLVIGAALAFTMPDAIFEEYISTFSIVGDTINPFMAVLNSVLYILDPIAVGKAAGACLRLITKTIAAGHRSRRTAKDATASRKALMDTMSKILARELPEDASPEEIAEHGRRLTLVGTSLDKMLVESESEDVGKATTAAVRSMTAAHNEAIAIQRARTMDTANDAKGVAINNNNKVPTGYKFPVREPKHQMGKMPDYKMPNTILPTPASGLPDIVSDMGLSSFHDGQEAKKKKAAVDRKVQQPQALDVELIKTAIASGVEAGMAANTLLQPTQQQAEGAAKTADTTPVTYADVMSILEKYNTSITNALTAGLASYAKVSLAQSDSFILAANAKPTLGPLIGNKTLPLGD